MRYRSRTDITAQILNVTTEGANKTRIMYGAYLSYSQLKEYMSLLQNNGLLEYVEGERIYRTTGKGREFLQSYGQLNALTGSITTSLQPDRAKQ